MSAGSRRGTPSETAVAMSATAWSSRRWPAIEKVAAPGGHAWPSTVAEWLLKCVFGIVPRYR